MERTDRRITSANNASYFMAGYVMNMSTLVSNINRRGQKDFSFKVRHKAYARPLPASLKKADLTINRET